MCERATPRTVNDGHPPWRLFGRRHTDDQIVPILLDTLIGSASVLEAPSAVVLAVDADAVEKIAVAFRR